MGAKLTYDFIKTKFADEGYELLSEVYIEAHYKLKYKCPEGHIGYINWNGFQQGHRCPVCQQQISPSIEEVRLSFEKEGYTLLSDKYINRQSKLEYMCPNSHIRSMTWASWCRGRRCPKCARKEKYKIEDIREAFSKEGYELLAEEYTNSSTPLKYRCPKNHIGYITWEKWERGHRCRSCANERWKGKNNPHWKGLSEQWKSEYKGYRTKVSVITRRNYNKSTWLINPLNLNKQQYHIDHLYSVSEGFKNGIDPNIIASPINLRLIPQYDNISKGGRSDITKEELYFLYDQFNMASKISK
jgi:hypothetical protein